MLEAPPRPTRLNMEIARRRSIRCVRTTLTIDDDVLNAARERAKRERRSVGDVLSDLARDGLTSSATPSSRRRGSHGFHPLPHRGRPVTNTLIDDLRADASE